MRNLHFSFLFLLLAFAWSSASSAQEITKGSLSVFADQKNVNMICDFENCTVDKHSIEYAKDKYDNWDLGVVEITKRFSVGYNDKSKDYCKFGAFPEAKYTLIYHLFDIDDDQDTKGTIDIIETQSKELVVHIEKANGSAGTFGSFFNLLGDAFENLGKKLGKLSRK
ncbi:MAG: hypothetical protein J6Y59_06825 [Bacteroidaceae bacterium]|nr:hypothetical protein [Bacteroidaceae bacterium]